MLVIAAVDSFFLILPSEYNEHLSNIIFVIIVHFLISWSCVIACRDRTNRKQCISKHLEELSFLTFV